MTIAPPITVTASTVSAEYATGTDHGPWVLNSLKHSPTFVRELIAGGAAGGISKTCVAPLERCKILFQTGKLVGGKVGSTLSYILQTEGPRGLFVGNGASVLRIIPYASVHFGLYEYYRRTLVGMSYGNSQYHGQVSPVLDLVAGSSAGATAVLLTYPLDLVRTRLAYMTETSNAQRHSRSKLMGKLSIISKSSSIDAHTASTNGPKNGLDVVRRHGIRSVLGDTLKKEGVKGTFRGIGPSLYGILPYAGLKFYVYQHLKQFYFHHMSPLNDIVSGDVFDDNALDGRSSRGSSSSSNSGPISSSAAALPGHNEHQNQQVNPIVEKKRLPILFMLSFGAISGLVAQTVTYPLDVVRRRMQVEGLQQPQQPSVQTSNSTSSTILTNSKTQVSSQIPPHQHGRLPKSTPLALLHLAKKNGWRSLYAGLSINYLKVVPSTAIGFTIYDYLKATLDLPSNL